MYSIYNDIIQFKSRNEVVDLVNDEGDAYDDVDLTSESDSRRIRIDKAITAADSEIDGYLMQRYKLPLTETPVLIKHISISLALEALYMRRHSDTISEAVAADAKTKRALLKDIAKGLVGLGVETTDSKPAAGTYLTDKKSTDRVFTKDVLDKY
jgi:phage gp36-like protein